MAEAGSRLIGAHVVRDACCTVPSLGQLEGDVSWGSLRTAVLRSHVVRLCAPLQPAHHGLWCPPQRLLQLQAETPEQPIQLRLEVEGGGCSGYSYAFKLERSDGAAAGQAAAGGGAGGLGAEDRLFEVGGARVVCDSVSLELLRGATVEFEDSLMRSAFQARACAAAVRGSARGGCWL
jgi:iron-sulfur cluster assembly accessory protein